jgi:hypothetical protein
VLAESESAETAEPSAQPPHSKFHPVPTRPVFASVPVAAESLELVPAPDAEDEQEQEPKHLDPPTIDELPTPNETEDEPPANPIEVEADEPADGDEVLETKSSGHTAPIHPASVELHWVDAEAP